MIRSAVALSEHRTVTSWRQAELRASGKVPFVDAVHRQRSDAPQVWVEIGADFHRPPTAHLQSRQCAPFNIVTSKQDSANLKGHTVALPC